MTKHCKIYFKHFGYGEQDYILCEMCYAKSTDLHHIIYKSRGGKDEINNIMALCRNCHNDAHNEHIKPHELQPIHDNHLKMFIRD